MQRKLPNFLVYREALYLVLSVFFPGFADSLLAVKYVLTAWFCASNGLHYRL